ncbi:MAG: late competence development ComFB family protein [Pseudanabaenaceae cyanobacterium bins.39]|nr:late competence development ComFB family protein [Pseudanabaenaceae cyanobacterium bins.39]
MTVFTNVLEEIVVQNTYNILEEIRPELKPKVRVSEVVAFTLNRLPPLFSTSLEGWTHQYNYALNALSDQIEYLIKKGIQIVLSGDPLHDNTPLPNQLFLNSAGVLYQLGQVINKKYLRWKDVPMLVQDLLELSEYKVQDNLRKDETIIQGDDDTVIQTTPYLSANQRHLLSRSRRFISKQQSYKDKYQAFLNKHQSWADEKKSRDALAMEYRALESFTLHAELGMVNVLEHLIFLAIEKCTTPDIYEQINHSEVAAYAMNRLPPMYATSVRGFRYLRQRAISEFSRDLIGVTRNGILKVLKVSRIDIPKIHAYNFVQEYENAILEVRQILRRNDIYLENIVAVVSELMDLAVVAS